MIHIKYLTKKVILSLLHNVVKGSAIFLFFSPFVYGASEEPPKTGNYILPYSQQPGSFLSFGQNVLSKSQVQLGLFPDDYLGLKKHYVDIYPYVVYGITDNLSVLLALPIAASYKEDQSHSAGFEDTFLQLEYAFYNHSTRDFADQASVVAYASFPTGSSQKVPATGYGAPSFFLGGTFYRGYTNWFFFTSHGVLVPTTRHKTKFGNSILYQGGLGRNIFNINSKWIFAGTTEIIGQYWKKNKIDGVIDPDSGGNVIYLIPSIWLSSKNLIFQLGIGYAVIQHLNGDQKRYTYLLGANVQWSIGT